jgi:divinyl protochlorophyllide a 8-vinyl-reductase
MQALGEAAQAGGAAVSASGRGKCVGPNSVIQLAAALAACDGGDTLQRVFARAGQADLLAALPDQMVAESVPAALFAAVRSSLPTDRADAVLREAGRRTGMYILANRIPALAKSLLRALPSHISIRLLLALMTRHAWTFAGSGLVTPSYGSRLSMTISGNPLVTPGCPWHVAVLECLAQNMAGRSWRVSHPKCHGRGDKACRFDFN